MPAKKEGYEDEVVNFKIPKALGEKIDKFVKAHPDSGYRSRTEFIIYVIRKAIDDLEKASSQ